MSGKNMGVHGDFAQVSVNNANDHGNYCNEGIPISPSDNVNPCNHVDEAHSQDLQINTVNHSVSREGASPSQNDSSMSTYLPANDITHETQGENGATNESQDENDGPVGPIACGTQNRHHMVTRSKLGIFKPKSYLLDHEVEEECKPKTVQEALKSRNRRPAVMAEFEALTKNETWQLVPLPEGRSIVGCKWLFRVKKNADSIQRYKARLVAKRFPQIPGQDFHDTFSPVVKPATINTMLSLVVCNKWKIRQMDVNNVGSIDAPHGVAKNKLGGLTSDPCTIKPKSGGRDMISNLDLF